MYAWGDNQQSDWPSTLSTVRQLNLIHEALQPYGLQAENVHIETRYKVKLCFTICCICGMRVKAEVDLIDDDAKQRHAVDWMTGVVVRFPLAHGNCVAPKPALPPSTEPFDPEPDRPKPTPEQMRELMRDPFIRALLSAFGPEPEITNPDRRAEAMPNVLGAQFPDGAVFRRWPVPEIPGTVASLMPDTAYAPGQMPRAAKANWGGVKRKK